MREGCTDDKRFRTIFNILDLQLVRRIFCLVTYIVIICRYVMNLFSELEGCIKFNTRFRTISIF